MFKSDMKKALKKIGLSKHPVDGRALASHSTMEIMKLYIKYVEGAK